MFGAIDYENFDEDKINEKYKDKPILSDEISLILIDRYQMVDLIGQKLGKAKAREVLDNYVNEMPWTLFEVQSDDYIVKFTPNIQKLKTIEKQDDYLEINPLFILRSETLENKLKQTGSSKPKM